jgi:hypothetical protein
MQDSKAGTLPIVPTDLFPMFTSSIRSASVFGILQQKFWVHLYIVKVKGKAILVIGLRGP